MLTDNMDNIEAERASLGSCLLNKESMNIAFENMRINDYYSTNHQKIFQGMTELIKLNITVDLVTLSENLQSKDQLQKIGGVNYLTQLINSVPNAVNIEYYNNIIKKKANQRRILFILEKLKTGKIDTQQALDFISKIPVLEVKEENLKTLLKNTLLTSADGVDYKFKIRSLNHYLGGVGKGELITIGGFTSQGKCLKKGTRVVMFSGELKKVEDIKMGDLLMGIDSTPRKVINLYSGIDDLYTIRQNRGMDYTVNSRHILTLRKSDYAKKIYFRRNRNKWSYKYTSYDDTLNISIGEYLNKSKGFKKCFKGYKTGVEFIYKDINIEPYFLGIWLGDGNSDSIGITTMDKEIEEYIYQYSSKLNLDITKKTQKDNKSSVYIFKKKIIKVKEGNHKELCHNKKWLENKYLIEKLSVINISKIYGIKKSIIYWWLYKYNIPRREVNSDLYKEGKINELEKRFRQYNLIDNKHIPDNYLYNTRKIRLQILAGLIDTDGYKNKNGYQITQKNKKLSYQIYYLASSLGFRCNISKTIKTIKSINFRGIYYRIGMVGDVQNIPVLVERKKIKIDKQTRNPFTTGIKVEYDGKGEYFGFTLDRDGFFLLEDFTVLHNTSFALQLAIDFIDGGDGKKVLYLTSEMTTLETARRILSNEMPKNMMEFRKGDFEKGDKKALSSIADIIGDHWQLNIKKVFDIDDIKKYIRKYEPEIVFIDYLQNLDRKGARSDYEKVTGNIKDIQRITLEGEITTFVLSQLARNKEGIREPKLTDLRDSGRIEECSNIVILIYWEDRLKEKIKERKGGEVPEQIEVRVVKNRDGTIGRLTLDFEPEYSRIKEKEYAKDYQESDE